MADTSGIDAVLREAVEAGEVPGVAAVAGNAAGTLYEGAFGRRALDRPEPMTVDTVAWIASMTKAVTTVAALQLVEEGRLSLDGPIAEVVRELAEPQVLEGFAADGTAMLRTARRPITLRHLLTHTAGFSYDIWNADIGRYMAQQSLPGIISCRRNALRTPLVADPGERWEYGINIDWVGIAVEKVAGKRLGQVMRERVFGPLGMVDTDYRLGAAQRERLAGVHARTPEGLSRIEFEVAQEPEFEMGGGGLYGTARDYLRFCRMILNGGELDGARILQPETVAEMSRNQIGALTVRPMLTAMPASSNDAEFFPGMEKKWGLGFLINTEDAPAGGRAAGSLAWAGLANTYYWIDPKRDRAGVIVTQILPFADPAVLDLLTRFERAVYHAG
ncbi:MAG TPA: serine hydrolase domain-containing protein [Crenalkalicoccus sp.]|nr:serine hydrolase domain-containing protein [Crenalkalicoccus sp.]